MKRSPKGPSFVPAIRLRRFCVIFLLCICLAQVIRAQDPAPSAQPTETQSQSPKDAAQNPTTSSTTETKDKEKSAKAEEKKKEEEKKAHRGSIVVAPLPIVSPAIGSGIVPVVGYIFPLQVNKEHPEPSVIGAAGLATNNGTRGFGLGGDVYLKEARYEIKAVYVHGNIDYNLYGVGYANGNAGLKLPLVQTGEVFFIEFLRNIGWDFYVGGRFVTGNSFITIKPTEGVPLPPIPPDVELQTNLRALGMEVVRDSRPNRFYPLKGSLVDFTGDFFANSLGSKYSFQSYKFTINKYASLNSKQVLAYNLFFCGTGGAPPFYGNCIYGTNNELRGYTAGRYLDRYMLGTQLEYRLVLPWRLGLVAFGGVGEVAPGVDKFHADALLPSGGTGIRFLLSKKYHVNLRTDFAWGKDNFTWSMGVGEAF
ncbi:MAG: BamA/TamA family outer membrane protein [Candidatus Acidiferrum sp.]|jgi:hypothetical protein